MIIAALTASLVIIDMQTRLMPAIDAGDAVLKQCIGLASIARLCEIPIIGTEQSPKSLGHNVEEIRLFCQKTVIKQHFDACADGLIEALPAGRPDVIISGCEAHVCLMQTVLGLRARGRHVFVVADAIGSRDPRQKERAIARMEQAGAKIVTVEMVAFESVRTSQHPAFRDVLKLIK